MIGLISVLSFLGVCYLLIKGSRKPKEDKVDILDDKYYHLPKLLGNPVINDIDPGYKVLRDVIFSCKSEGWKYEVKRDSSLTSYVYDVVIKSNDGSVTIMSRIRIYDDIQPNLVSFTIRVSEGNISYLDVDKGIELELLDFIWNYCLYPDSKKLHDEKLDYYNKVRDVIKSKLVSLNRGRKLDQIV